MYGQLRRAQLNRSKGPQWEAINRTEDRPGAWVPHAGALAPNALESAAFGTFSMVLLSLSLSQGSDTYPILWATLALASECSFFSQVFSSHPNSNTCEHRLVLSGRPGRGWN